MTPWAGGAEGRGGRDQDEGGVRMRAGTRGNEGSVKKDSVRQRLILTNVRETITVRNRSQRQDDPGSEDSSQGVLSTRKMRVPVME